LAQLSDDSSGIMLPLSATELDTLFNSGDFGEAFEGIVGTDARVSGHYSMNILDAFRTYLSINERPLRNLDKGKGVLLTMPWSEAKSGANWSSIKATSI
jgi:hypothetical protein